MNIFQKIAGKAKGKKLKRIAFKARSAQPARDRALQNRISRARAGNRIRL